MRVLVVDDNRDASESLGLILRRREHELVACHDGETALRAAEEQRPDVVLLDLGLPGIDGFEVCRRLRQSRHDRAFVVAITGYGQDENCAAAAAT